MEADRCQVCGRGPALHDSLYLGVHANCSDHLEVKEMMMLAIRDSRQPGKVWYCGNGGLIFVTDYGKG